MTINDWLKTSSQKLKQAGIGTARLDCLVLLEDITKKNKAWLLAHPEFKLSDTQIKKLNTQLKHREKHLPLAQIRGKTEFYGRDFIISPSVLEPRPESETMIELLKKLPKSAFIVDVGTGSGALAITAKLEMPESMVTAIDIDQKCLEVTHQNAKKHSVKVEILKGNLLKPINTRKLNNSVLLCNLPYVPNDYEINRAALNEPKIAIFGGKDGLDLYRKLFKQIAETSHKPSYVLTESLPFQHKDLAKIAQKADFKQTAEDDFIQQFN